MITPEQIRAGRALINAKQSDLAVRAGISLATLNNIERSIARPRGKTMSVIESALQAEGIEILQDSLGVGVRLKAYERTKYSDSRSVVENIVYKLKETPINQIQRCVLCFSDTPTPHFFVWLNYDVRHIIFDNCAFDMANKGNAQDFAGLILSFNSAGINIDIMKNPQSICDMQTIDAVSNLLNERTEPYQGITDVLDMLHGTEQLLEDVKKHKSHLLNYLL